MSEPFQSIRKKLVIKLGLTYLSALLFVFALIIIKNTLDFNKTITETQHRIETLLNNKGMLLINNNSNVLVGLVEDNAFSAVKELVTNTVLGNEDVLYGIFTDDQKNHWVYAFKNDYYQTFSAIVDKNSTWAYQQTIASASFLYFDKLRVVEFTAPVIVDHEILGFIRYGLSTEELTKTIKAANEQATDSLRQTLFALFLIGMVTLLLVFWRTDQVAKKITVPLNLLTNAANIVASGKYEQTIHIQTNDEIGMLAHNFDDMTTIIKGTIADLAKINQVGNALAKTRDEKSAYFWVIKALIKQLNFQTGLVLQCEKNREVTLLSSYQSKDVSIEALVSFVSQRAEIVTIMNAKQPMTVPKLLVTHFTEQYILKSLVFMPFGVHKKKPIYVVLFSEIPDKDVSDAELEFCQSIKNLLVTSLQNIEMNELLEEQNKDLEKKVNQRTGELSRQNETLSKTLKELEHTQTQLIESEKMASLGSLVAGISHEVNTPLGVSVTAASHLCRETQKFEVKFEHGELTKSGFLSYMKSADETAKIILSNLERAATLINSFKQIAVDQNSDQKTLFNLKTHLEMLITSLRPSYKLLPIMINLQGDDIEIFSYAGLISQVVTNIIVNSVKHGLINCKQGKIDVIIKRSDEQVIIEIADNGVGIPDEIKKKVFDPFFTTARGNGSSGLGLNIVYNIIKQKLHGDIQLVDNEPNGTRFIVNL